MPKKVVSAVLPLIEIMLLVWSLLIAVLYIIDRIFSILPKGLIGQVTGYSIAFILLGLWLTAWYKLTKMYFWKTVKKSYSDECRVADR